MNDFAFLSAVELGALLRERQVSPVEVVEAALRAHRGTRSRASARSWTSTPSARSSRRGAVDPDDRRVFAGVPIAIKANTPAAGLVMDYGSRLLAGHRMPTTTRTSSGACATRGS